MSNQSFASAARTASFTGDTNGKNPGASGVLALLNITVAPGVETLTLNIQGRDPVSGTFYTIVSSAATVATGLVKLMVGRVSVVANVAANELIPDQYRVTVTHSAGSSWTYSVSVTEVM